MQATLLCNATDISQLLSIYERLASQLPLGVSLPSFRDSAKEFAHGARLRGKISFLRGLRLSIDPGAEADARASLLGKGWLIGEGNKTKVSRYNSFASFPGRFVPLMPGLQEPRLDSIELAFDEGPLAEGLYARVANFEEQEQRWREKEERWEKRFAQLESDLRVEREMHLLRDRTIADLRAELRAREVLLQAHGIAVPDMVSRAEMNEKLEEQRKAMESKFEEQLKATNVDIERREKAMKADIERREKAMAADISRREKAMDATMAAFMAKAEKRTP